MRRAFLKAMVLAGLAPRLAVTPAPVERKPAESETRARLPHAAAGLIVPSRPGRGTPVIMGEGGSAEVAVPVRRR